MNKWAGIYVLLLIFKCIVICGLLLESIEAKSFLEGRILSWLSQLPLKWFLVKRKRPAPEVNFIHYSVISFWRIILNSFNSHGRILR